MSLRARLGGLLQLDVGVQGRLDAATVHIRGAETEVMLEVRLDELRAILDRALTTVDRNPQLVEPAPRPADTTADRAGRATPPAEGPPELRSPTRRPDVRDGDAGPGSPARRAWHRMWQLAGEERPLRRAAARLLPGRKRRRQGRGG